LNITLQKVKIITAMSEETLCYTAVICLDGKPVATASNRGHGGPDEYHFTDRAVEKQMVEYVKSLPPVAAFGTMLPMSMEMYIGELVEKFDHDKKVAAQRKRWCKTKTVFRLKGDKEGSYLTINHVFTPVNETV